MEVAGSCLENPRDGGAWWAAVYGVTQNWTQLKRLSSSSSMFTEALLESNDELPLAISWGPDFPGATREAP